MTEKRYRPGVKTIEGYPPQYSVSTRKYPPNHLQYPPAPRSTLRHRIRGQDRPPPPTAGVLAHSPCRFAGAGTIEITFTFPDGAETGWDAGLSGKPC